LRSLKQNPSNYNDQFKLVKILRKQAGENMKQIYAYARKRQRWFWFYMRFHVNNRARAYLTKCKVVRVV